MRNLTYDFFLSHTLIVPLVPTVKRMGSLLTEHTT